MSRATLVIGSKNYSSWSLRGWLLAKMAGLEFDEEMISSDDPVHREELLLVAPSILIPCLIHDGTEIWDTLAIAEYLNEIKPKAGLLPKDRAARARCRSVSGEIHSGFNKLRSSCPMNLRGRRLTGYDPYLSASDDIDRIVTIWRDCLAKSGGPFLFGDAPTMADAMYAPVVTRFLTYAVKTDSECASYCAAIMAMPAMVEWVAAAKLETEEISEFEGEF
jgi:glutathione S-transferase